MNGADVDVYLCVCVILHYTLLVYTGSNFCRRNARRRADDIVAAWRPMMPPVLQCCVRRYENYVFVLINMVVILEKVHFKTFIPCYTTFGIGAPLDGRYGSHRTCEPGRSVTD